jgi:hypothetical protein
MNSNNYHPICVHPIYGLHIVTQMNSIHITRPYLIDTSDVIIAYSLNYLQSLAA